MTSFTRVVINAVAVVVLIFLIGCREEQLEKAQAPAPKVKPFSYSSPVLEVPGSRMREVYLSSYRLKPDKRFLDAFAELRHLITREPRKSVEARFSGDHWTILHAGEQLGQVSELPDYSEFKPLLSMWASRLIKSSNFRLLNNNAAATTSSELFITPESILDLKKIDQAWTEGKLTSDSMRQASRHLTHLMLQHLDRLEMADLLAARSLAMIVLTESLSGEPLSREECLLAHAMGYTRYASDLAEHLDKKDTVRMFIAQQDSELQKKAMSDKADRETRYLFLLRIAAKRDTPAWSKFADLLLHDDLDSLGVVKTGIEVKRFELAGLSRVIQPLVFRDISKIAPAQVVDLQMLGESNQAARTQKFESILKNVGKAQKGPIWDDDMFSSFYRAYFYSALDVEARHYVDSLASIEATKNFNEKLDQKSSKWAEDFSLWYSALTSGSEGKTNSRLVLTNLDKISLGADALMRWFELLRTQLHSMSPELTFATRQIASRLDSRPSHCFILEDIGWDQLADFNLVEKLCKNIVRNSSSGASSKVISCAHFLGKDDLVVQLLHSPQEEFSSRATALFLLRRDNPDRNFVRKEFQYAVRLKPESWNLRSEYVDFLRDGKEFRETCATIQNWIDKYGENSSGFDDIHAHIRLAHTYKMMGEYDKAWAAIEPVVSSWQANALSEAADILDYLDRKKESEKFTSAVLERYPGSLASRISAAQISWRNGRYKEAAELFRTYKYPITADGWCFEVAPGFAEAFEKADEKAVTEAVATLLKIGIRPTNLICLDDEIAKKGNYKLAFRVQTDLIDHGGLYPVSLVDAYRYLAQLEGREKALKWAGSKVPQPNRNRYSIDALRQKQYDLLWEFIQEPNPKDRGDVVWLLRAAGFARDGGSDIQKQALFNYFKQPGNEYTRKLGMYLMGLLSESEILALATNPDKKCEASFYIGIKAQGEGRYEDASDWFRIALDTGVKDDLAYELSQVTLYVWAQKSQGLWKVAKEKL